MGNGRKLPGPRLHIDKAMLREWREDFARMMRDQGIAANATPRAVRGQGKKGMPPAAYQTRRHGHSHAIRAQVESIARELTSTGAVRDSAHKKLAETRKAIVAGWKAVAAAPDAPGLRGRRETSGPVIAQTKERAKGLTT